MPHYTRIAFMFLLTLSLLGCAGNVYKYNKIDAVQYDQSIAPEQNATTIKIGHTEIDAKKMGANWVFLGYTAVAKGVSDYTRNKLLDETLIREFEAVGLPVASNGKYTVSAYFKIVGENDYEFEASFSVIDSANHQVFQKNYIAKPETNTGSANHALRMAITNGVRQFIFDRSAQLAMGTASNHKFAANKMSPFDDTTQQKELPRYSINIQTEPPSASVRIMNISPKYTENMYLEKGRYDVLVQHPGYKPYRSWIKLNDNRILTVKLDKEKPKKAPERPIDTLLASSSTSLMPVTTQSVLPPKMNRTALVIGNSKYVSDPLKNPKNDASDIAKSLRRKGFEVTLRTDVNQREMEGSIDEFYHKLQRRGGVGLFYYAGHGIQINGENYMIPVDSAIKNETDVKWNSTPVEKVLGYMDEANSALNILILDACRNNPIERSFRSAARGLAKIRMPKSDLGYLVAYSTEPGEVALDGSGRNSPFTRHLLNAMTKNEKSLSAIFRKVRRNVYMETDKKQHPLVVDGTLEDFNF